MYIMIDKAIAIASVTFLVQILKLLGVPKHFALILALFLSIGAVVLYIYQNTVYNIIIDGIAISMGSIGVYETLNKKSKK